MYKLFLFVLMEELDANFWSARYQNNQTGWDLGVISPPLKAYFYQLTNKDLKILIPGCGRGYEGIYLWNNGFKNVHFADFSSEAIQSIKKSCPYIPDDQLYCQDFFSIKDKYDLIVEQTMFCAIDPSLRAKYLEKAESILRSNGKMIGLLFNRNFNGGPPFGGSKVEYLALFTNHFKVKFMDDCYNSIAPRMGHELFFIAEKKI
jgi:SAM-dependent methyltransferase